MNAAPPYSSGVSSTPTKKRLVGKIIILVVVILVVVGAIVLGLMYTSPKSVVTSVVTNLTPLGEKKPSEVQIKTEYKNPFDRSNQYVNPFDEFKSPFTVLQ